MHSAPLFNILDRVDSTNNYAMARLRDGLARNGEAWFAREQFAGRGQRKNAWSAEPGMNVNLSVILHPPHEMGANPFLLSALVAVRAAGFLKACTGNNFFIKWPNDLFCDDRKAAGILIENRWVGNAWRWAVVGIGVNVNTESFPQALPHAVSLYQLCGKKFDVEAVARGLYETLLHAAKAPPNRTEVLSGYNRLLYRLDERVSFRDGNRFLDGTVERVTENGFLILREFPERQIAHGELEWIL